MRVRGVVLVLVLVVAAAAATMVVGCGTGDEERLGDDASVVDVAEGGSVPSPVSDDAPPGEGATPVVSTTSLDDVAAALLGAFDDEESAAAAVLLAADRGYTLAQIIDASLGSTLRADGTVAAADGTPIPPSSTAPSVLVDDVVGADGAGFARTETTDIPLSRVLDVLRNVSADVGAQMFGLVLIFLDKGYSIDQIATHLVTGGSMTPRFDLVEASGERITPAGPRLGLLAWAPPDDPVAPTSDDARLLDERIAAAVGVYPLSPDFAVDLLSTPDVDGVNSATGEMVVDPDGTVSGSFEYSISDVVELKTGSVTLEWSLSLTVPSTPVTLLDDGLAFTADAVVMSCEFDDCFPEFVTPVPGVIDADIGQIVLSQAQPYGDNTVSFQR